MKLKGPVPPKPGPSSPEYSPSTFFPLNQPTVSRPGSATRIGGPLSQVAKALPSWYNIEVFATLIFRMACSDPGRFERMTSKIVRKTRKTIVRSELNGFTRVAILGRMGVLRKGDVLVEMYTSVRTYWFTNSGWIWSCLLPLLVKDTPLSIPSPSNQWASRPRSSLVTGFPPFRTYSPPASSCGIVPV